MYFIFSFCLLKKHICIHWLKPFELIILHLMPKSTNKEKANIKNVDRSAPSIWHIIKYKSPFRSFYVWNRIFRFTVSISISIFISYSSFVVYWLTKTKITDNALLKSKHMKWPKLTKAFTQKENWFWLHRMLKLRSYYIFWHSFNSTQLNLTRCGFS